ncbi:hypothetical protein PVAP13_9KG467819 [Panicum virgatum]|uniref:Uncharacterized protein n=1 Tax=Panicum virgatum TaxID=38727 RepID=A0A8T0NCH8_PANVG|nr:hypothetical protein PVAP13_9KG467819 [Panicum virgatum]
MARYHPLIARADCSVLVYSAGTLSGVAVARSAFRPPFPSKRESRTSSHPATATPLRIAPASLCSAHQLVYSFLPTLSIVPPGRGPPPFHLFACAFARQPATR